MDRRKVQTFGQGRSLRLNIGVDLLSDIEGRLLAGAVDLDHQRRLPLKPRQLIRVGKTVDDPSDFAQTYVRPVRPRKEDEILELLTSVGLAFGTEENLSAIGLHGARRKIER